MPKRPRDPSQLAKAVVDEATGERSGRSLIQRDLLKGLDAIGFDELTDFLGETVHTAFRKGCDCADGHSVWSHMKQMPREHWSSAIDWMIWALRVSTDREKK